jgi:hypothetical protein
MASSSAAGNILSTDLSSCKQAMSGCSRSSQASRFGNRARMPLTLNVAIRNFFMAISPVTKGVLIVTLMARRWLLAGAYTA